MKKLVLFMAFICVFFNSNAQVSVAHQWTEEILFCIRNDFARPPIHARNLYHLSVVMHDAFAAYQPGRKTILLDNVWNGVYTPFYGVTIPETESEILAAQNEAISFACYRLLVWRFQNAPGVLAIYAELANKMSALGYNVSITSTNYMEDGPAALGNYIAQQMIAYGLQDGSNEAAGYANQYYTDGNPFLFPELPGNPNMVDPNRFQRLSLSNPIDQAGNPLPSSPPHLAPEWGNVQPFSLSLDDSEVLERDGQFYRVYHNPGPPPYIDTNVQTGLEDFFKWNFTMVSVWQSHLDTADNVMWDISPASSGNVPFESLPDTWEEYYDFYNFYEGGDNISSGYPINPITNQPYEPQLVRRGDYARVLAEFWADGLDSETPPGHWFNIYNTVSQHPLFVTQWKGEGPILSNLEYDIQAYLLLGGSMHDAAIGAWAVKGYYDYLRPVSAIRFMGDRGQSSDPMLPNYHPAGMPIIPGYVELVLPGDPLVGDNDENLYKIKLYTWKGHDFIEDPDTDMAGVGWILAENWWPYQRPSFVSPPFAGYVSGHSTYSRAAARVMDFMTGTPYFPGGMSNFVAEENDFLEFEEGPSETIILQWATYYDASDQCSLSRVWGGIHPVIDDIPGRKIGQQVGTDASNFADSLFLLNLPTVENVVFSTDVINSNMAGSQFSISVSYDQEMSSSIFPSVTFLGNASIQNVLSLLSAEWINVSTVVLTYDILDFSLEAFNVDISIFDAQNLSGVRQSPKLYLDGFSIDTKLPELTSVVPSISFVNSIENEFCVQFLFDEPCDVNSSPNLVWSGIQNVDDVLSQSIVSASWSTNQLYSVCFDISQSVLNTGVVSVSVSNVTDSQGNLMQEIEFEDVLTIDVVQPILTLSVSDDLLNISNIGSNAITITINSSKPLQSSSFPLLTFSGTQGEVSTLVFNSVLSSWISSTSCNLVYNLQVSPVQFTPVSIQVSNVLDLSQNPPSENAFADVFSLDTRRPEILDLSSNYDYMNDNAVADANLYIDILFDEEMSVLSNPSISLNDEFGSPLPGVTYNIFQSFWFNQTTYRARFTINDLNMELSNLQLSVSLARDFADNLMVPIVLISPIDLDTRNPKVLEVFLSDSELNQSTTSIVITSIFDEPMAADVIPNFTAVTSEGDIAWFTPLSTGVWIDDYTYEGEYEINPTYFNGSFGLRPVVGNDLASNQIVDTVFTEVGFANFLFLNIADLGSLDVLLFPNPVKSGDLINIRSNTFDLLGSDIRLYDLRGSEISASFVENSTFQYSFLIPATLESGVYMIRINSGSGVLNLKINVIH